MSVFGLILISRLFSNVIESDPWGSCISVFLSGLSRLLSPSSPRQASLSGSSFLSVGMFQENTYSVVLRDFFVDGVKKKYFCFSS